MVKIELTIIKREIFWIVTFTSFNLMNILTVTNWQYLVIKHRGSKMNFTGRNESVVKSEHEVLQKVNMKLYILILWNSSAYLPNICISLPDLCIAYYIYICMIWQWFEFSRVSFLQSKSLGESLTSLLLEELLDLLPLSASSPSRANLSILIRRCLKWTIRRNRKWINFAVTSHLECTLLEDYRFSEKSIKILIIIKTSYLQNVREYMSLPRRQANNWAKSWCTVKS